ncbi:MAG: hypothetical protein WB424_16745 [Terracidiphilus sp.]
MADQITKIVQEALTQESAIWVQRDAHWSKGPSNPTTVNPFVQPQSTLPQTPVNSAAPTGSQQKKP